MQFDALLHQAGEFGPFQLMLFLLIGIVNMYTGMENMVINFLSPEQHEHWCLVPELEGMSVDVARTISIPWDAETGEANMDDVGIWK